MTGDKRHGYHWTSWWLTRNDCAISRTRMRKDQRWSWWNPIYYLFFSRVMTLSNWYTAPTKWSCHCMPYNKAYGFRRNSNVGSDSASKDLRAWTPSFSPDSSVSWVIIHVRSQFCLGTTSTGGHRTVEWRPSCAKGPYTISLSLSDLSQTSRVTTYVRHYDTSFSLAVYVKLRT